MALGAKRRRLAGLVLAGSLALVPTVAGASPVFDLGRQPTIQEKAGGFLAWVEEVFVRIWEETGMMIDPDDNPPPSGAADGDTGKLIDPNG